MAQISVSHSSKDTKPLDFLNRAFASTEVQAKYEEIEAIVRGKRSAAEIAADIAASKATFVGKPGTGGTFQLSAAAFAQHGAVCRRRSCEQGKARPTKCQREPGSRKGKHSTYATWLLESPSHGRARSRADGKAKTA
jgi:hypothetical protein